MSALDRRRFLRTAGGVAAAAAVGGTAAACAPAPGAAALDQSILGALGEAVLPDELGPDGIERAVAAFRAWLTGYQPAVEITHGYGTGNVEYTPAHPGPGWQAQLEALDLEARQRFGAAFAALGKDQRAEMVRRQVARERVDRLPDPVQARHVAVGLLAHWARTPEAANLCYQAAIDPLTCRPLAEQIEKPTPLAGS
jgi:hypothetical protein